VEWNARMSLIDERARALELLWTAGVTGTESAVIP
jgi:hypothetical protein